MNPISTARSRRETRLRIEARLASLNDPEPLIDPDVLAARLARYVAPSESDAAWRVPAPAQPLGRRILLTLARRIA